MKRGEWGIKGVKELVVWYLKEGKQMVDEDEDEECETVFPLFSFIGSLLL